MRRLWCLVAAVVLAIGCGSGGGPVLPVNGIVTMDGTPLADATVTFFPEVGTEGGTVGSAQTGSDGKFVILGTKGQKGLALGKYKVTVSKMKVTEGSGSPEDPSVGAVTDIDVKYDLPPIYSHRDQTKLSYSVTGDGKPIEIPLSSRRQK